MPDLELVQTMNSLPAMYHHCCDTYEAMSSQAETRETDLQTPQGEVKTIEVYRGFFTKLVTGKEKDGGLNFNTPYFSAIKRSLEAMGCINQLRRGGGGQPSEWEIIQPPTPELWRLVDDALKKQAPKNKNVRDIRAVEQQNRDLQEQINFLRGDLELMKALLRDKGIID